MTHARVLWFTGPGGAGTTTIAAATALRCADADGGRTLLLSSDVGALADALDRPVEVGPAAVGDDLWAGSVAPPADAGGATDPADIDGLARSGRWDTVVIDAGASVSPIDPGSVVRLVVTPESRVLAAARRTLISLALAGRPVDAVVANRVLPPEVVDPWFESQRRRQGTHLADTEAGLGVVPLLRAHLTPTEVVGPGRLRALAHDLYGDDHPGSLRSGAAGLRIGRGDGGYDLTLPLPLVSRHEIDLGRQGLDLWISIGDQEGRIGLPDSLRRRSVAGARFEHGQLVVHFADPP